MKTKINISRKTREKYYKYKVSMRKIRMGSGVNQDPKRISNDLAD